MSSQNIEFQISPRISRFTEMRYLRFQVGKGLSWVDSPPIYEGWQYLHKFSDAALPTFLSDANFLQVALK